MRDKLANQEEKKLFADEKFIETARAEHLDVI